MTKQRVPARGAEDWFQEDDRGIALLGVRCTTCGTVLFPRPPVAFCRNPACEGTDFEDTRLATRGTVWAATAANYQPPAPYVSHSDPFEPFAIAAVSLAADGLVVLGQVVAGVSAEDLPLGTEVELVADTLFEDDSNEYTIWKWKPVEMGAT